MDALKYTLEQYIAEAQMIQKPFIIVEGVNDVATYENILNHNNFNANIIPIELIDGYSKGCEQVIKAANDPTINFEEKSVDGSCANDIFFGIIDKDVRDFRNEIPNNQRIFALKHYSIESFFVSQTPIIEVIRRSTRSTKEILEKIDSVKIFSNFLLESEIYFLASLESLKKATDKNYTAIFSYESDIFSAEKNPVIKKTLMEKRSDLLKFAQSIGISISQIFCIKKITHGKWLLDIFSKYLFKYINSLSTSCKSNKIYQCSFCKLGIDSCLYQKNTGFSDALVKNDLKNSINVEDFVELYTRASALKYSK